METTKIKIDANISANTKKVWDAWTKPEHIINWNFASDDWHCPRAENDLRVGGKYAARMEAKDRTMGFDFEATYDEVIDQKRISYTMSDGRQATTVFENIDGVTKVEITFDAEDQNPIDMQKDGWQAILNSFKKYVEATKITPFLWFDNQAEKAINFYTSLFPNSEILQLKKWPEGGPYPSNTIQLGSFILDGVKFQAFDAGPQFKFNPSISFFVICETAAEVNKLWAGFKEGGEVLMPLDSYPWSDRYGWLTDQFGVSWQLMKGKLAEVGQKISPLLMFSGSQKRRAEEAIKFYMSVFEDSTLDGIAKYGPEVPANEGMVMHAQGKLMGQTFMVMDSGEDHEHPFNEAISFFITCKDQQEVDYYWNQLIADGGSESMCGWLKDKFGVSWQIVPELIAEKMTSGDPAKVEKMFQALLQMKKLIVADLEKAYNG